MNGTQLTRISEALYRVTELMPDEEPLKWSLRRRALDIIELYWDELSSSALKARIAQRERIGRLVEELIGLLELASGAAFISRINFEVLVREYRSYAGALKAIEEPLIELEGFTDTAPAQNIGESFEKTLPESASGAGKKAVRAAGQTFNRATSERGMQKSADALRLNHSLSAREERISAFLQQNKWASRSDILRAFHNKISGKTLQRELFSLVARGVLKKMGEKRWCKYALK